MDIDIFQLPGILWRRKLYIIVCVFVCVALAGAYVATMKPTYSSAVELLLDPAGLSADSGDQPGAIASTSQDQATLDSQIYVVLSRNTLGAVIRRLDLTADPFLAGKKPFADRQDAEAAVAAALKKRLKVTREGQSLVMTITAEHSDAGKAAEIANTVAETYLQQVDEARSGAAQRASSAFQVQAGELRDRVLKAELAVEKFRSDNGLISTGERGLVVDQQLAAINDQLTAARVAEEQQQTVFNQAQKLDMATVEIGAIPEVLQSQTIGQLRDRYIQLLDRQTQLSSTLGAGHPQLQAIRSQVANMQQAIRGEIERIRQSVKANYDRASANTKALAERLAQLTQSSFASDEAQIKMRQLENEADAVRAVYKTFLSRAEELGQRQSLNINGSRIITAAVPAGGSSSLLKVLVLAAAALFGVAAGSALAVAREILARFTSGRTRKQPAELVSAPSQAIPAETMPAPARVAPSIAQTATPAQPDLPVLAVVPIIDQPLRRGATSPLRLAAGDQAAREIASRRELGILTAAEAILAGLSAELPLTLAFVGSGMQRQASDVVAEIVQALVDCGQEITYAPGSLKAGARPATRLVAADHVRRPSLNAALADPAQAEGPVLDMLHYERLANAERRRQVSRPTYSRFIGEIEPVSEDLVIINACMPPLANRLEDVLAGCDLFVVLEAPGAEHAAAALAAARPDRALGRILLEDTGSRA